MAMTKRTIFPNHTDNDNPLDSIKGAGGAFNLGLENLLTTKFSRLVIARSFIHWARVPSWFAEDPDLKYFTALTQGNNMSFQGLSDINLTTTDVIGRGGVSIPVVSGIEVGNTDFSIEHVEYSGMPLTRSYRKWISLMRDPNNKIATYARMFNVEYCDYNHSGELYYIVTRPDANNETSKNVVEDAFLYLGVVPTNITTGILNTTNGQEEVPTITVNFKGTPYQGPKVIQQAQRILKDIILAPTADTPGYFNGVDSYGTDERFTSGDVLTAATIKDIYADTDE